MRYLAIGDIHGCYKALTTLTNYIELQPNDVVITLGDYVNRGPNSCAVLDWLIELSSTHKLVALMGNHDIMMLQARADYRTYEDWLECGGSATLKSYSSSESLIDLNEIPNHHWQFLESCLPFFEVETHFFVHANAYPDMPLNEQPEYMLYWEGFNDPPPHHSGKIMICGHTSQKSGLPKNIGHAICIDTWVEGKRGWLTCLDINTGKYWQANERGETRTQYLEYVGKI